MEIALAHERFDHLPPDQNIALSHFGYAGCVTVREILAAVAGRPDEDHVNLRGPVEDPEISICTKAELGKLFVIHG